MRLDTEQKRLFEIITQTEDHIFVTGRAGTGKSYLLQYFKEKSPRKAVVVAPTGVAALNVGGQTIHSLFVLPPTFLSEEKLKEHELTPRAKTVLRNVEVMVIDEVSMVRADLMDAIDHRLRTARKSALPFGGVQIVMFGDPYQLPPVVNDAELHKCFDHNYGGHYFFNASVWGRTALKIYELTKVFRQKEQDFKDRLDKIRRGEVDELLLEAFNRRIFSGEPAEGVLTLATTNQIVNGINARKLDQLKGKLFRYLADIEGDLQRSELPTDELLKLKEGAQVMFIKNDKDKRWVNGSLGVVKKLERDGMEVEVGGVTHTVGREKWHKIKYFYDQKARKINEEVVSSFIQYPLKLAWALTIHKAQGQTHDAVLVDMGNGAFAHGQTYVALSRCRKMDTLHLRRRIRVRDIIIDSSVRNFMEQATIMKVAE